MEVILLERVKYLGDMGAVVSVKPGYARNFLIPRKKALRATEINKQYFLESKADLKAQSDAKFEKAQGIYVIIDKNFITILGQAGEDGKLFGSVSARDISERVSSTYSQEISYSEVALEKPIKYVGIHEVVISLHSDLQAVVYVNVARTESEAEESKKAFLSPPSTSNKKS